MSDSGNLAAEAIKYFFVRFISFLAVACFLLGGLVVGLLWWLL